MTPPRRRTLAARLVIVTTAVATVAVLVAGLVSIRPVRTAAENQARKTLGRQADVAVELADERSAIQRPGLQRALRLDQIQTVRVSATGRLIPIDGSGVVTATDVQRLLAGQSISAVRRGRGGGRIFVEGRPTETGGGLVLFQPARVASGATHGALLRIGFALLIGLGIAAVAGVLLSRWLAGPLQRAAAAAHRMTAGARDVRLDAAGPAEVAEVAEALNSLAGALADSEARQREFLLSVSHELRTPLTAVKGYAEALADGVVPTEETARIGQTMLAEAGRLDRLVADLLDLARLGAQDFRLDVGDVELAEVVRQAGAVWSDRCAQAGIRFRTEVPDLPVVVRTDAIRVRQIIDGLTDNALRVTPAGAPIVIAVRPADAADVVTLEVRDGGPGLTEDDKRVAFDRSALYDRYRGERRVGTGIGLALVGGLAARLGGAAEVQTAPEGGAAFVIRLPRWGPPTSHPGGGPSATYTPE